MSVVKLSFAYATVLLAILALILASSVTKPRLYLLFIHSSGQKMLLFLSPSVPSVQRAASVWLPVKNHDEISCNSPMNNHLYQPLNNLHLKWTTFTNNHLYHAPVESTVIATSTVLADRLKHRSPSLHLCKEGHTQHNIYMYMYSTLASTIGTNVCLAPSKSEFDSLYDANWISYLCPFSPRRL